MEDQRDDTARARPGGGGRGGGGGGPAEPGGGGAPRRRDSPRRSLGRETRRSSQHPMEGGAEEQLVERGFEQQDGGEQLVERGVEQQDGGEQLVERGVEQQDGGDEISKEGEGVNDTSCFTTPQAAPAQAKGCSSSQLAAADSTAEDAGDEESIRPWDHFNKAAYKPAPPKPTRTITEPRRSASGFEIWTRAGINREEIDYTIQFEKISKSIATVGNGFSKVCAGFGLKIISQEEKDAAEAREKKVVEAKKVAEQKIIAEEKARAAELSATQFEEWKKKKEDEKRKVEKDKEKERRTDLLLSIPGHMVNISSVLDGLAEITSGSKEVVASVSVMVRSIPSLMRRIHGGTEGAVGESAQSRSMGTGSLGLRLALDRQVITRSYDGRVCVLDGFGEKKETVPRAFGGRLLIHNIEELNSAIFDFQSGKLRQLIDIDHNHVSLVVARDMWRVLCNEQLTGLLRPDSLLPEMALRAAALLDEETALQSHLEDAKKSVNELTSSISELRNKLEMSVDGMSVVQQTLKAKGK